MTVAEKVELFLWEEWCKEIKRNAVSDEFRSSSIDEFDPYEREIFISCLRRPNLSCYSITGLQSVLLDLIL